MFAVIPTLLTLCNAACGFGSITFSAKAEAQMYDLNYLFLAGLLIFSAMVFDMLDGHVARLTKQASHFGRQLDSLCDVISFGLAPALIVLKFSYHYHPRFLWVTAVLYLICVVLRLARFNLETEDVVLDYAFCGLPSPAAAGTVASIAIAGPRLSKLAEYGPTEAAQAAGEMLISATSLLLPIIMLAVACLMVSKIGYPHLNQWFRGRRNFHHLVQLIFAIVAVCAVHELAVPLVFLYFVMASPLRAIWSGAVGGRFGPSAAPRKYRLSRHLVSQRRSQPERFQNVASDSVPNRGSPIEDGQHGDSSPPKQTL
jgi:CDP-diacylglycerol--serine O-phosphatidyltransferase